MKRLSILSAAAMLLSLTAVADAQGIVGGAQQGAYDGGRVAGPVGGAVGAVVGGVTGGVVGGVRGVVGAPRYGYRSRYNARPRYGYRARPYRSYRAY